MTAAPTRRHESWRYADIDAAAKLWPVATQRHQVAAGDMLVREIVLDAANDAIEDHEVEIAAGGAAAFRIVVAGGGYGRVFVKALLGEGARFELHGAIVAGAARTGEIVTRVAHAGVGGTSRQVVRAVLGAGATGNYLGKVAVARGAQRTDGSQSVKAMLLDRSATANLKPELEIYADDVKCAHGATVGELDAHALFYLMSRGVGPAEAKALMLRAFVADAFRDIADAAARERLEAAAGAALEKLL